MDLAGYRRVLRGISGVHATAYDARGEIDAGLTGEIVGRIAQAGVHNIVTGGIPASSTVLPRMKSSGFRRLPLPRLTERLL